MTINKLCLDITISCQSKPDRELSPTNLINTLEDIINKAFQARFPEYEVEIIKLNADWPDSKKEFPEFNRKKFE